MRKKQKLKTIALFSGGGGLDLGFAAAGFDVRLSTDIDPVSCRTLEINQEKRRFFPDHSVLNKDITEIKGKDLIKIAGVGLDEVDLVIGGPPCQPFSVFGKRRGLNDSRGGLVWEFLRIIKEIKPKAFVFENVYGLASVHGGKVVDDLKSRLSLRGKYQVSVEHYELANYGIPQWRKRVFITGSRIGALPPRLKETHGKGNGVKPYNVVQDVLKDMPSPGCGLSNHRARNHSQYIIDRYSSMPFGMRDTKTRINRLYPDKPCFTIVVGSDKGGGKGHIHPYEPREVTPRESARLQTFPDWWEFTGGVRDMIRQVGNAVPPLFAALMAQHMKKHIFNLSDVSPFERVVKNLEVDFLSRRF